ncbi:MAG: glycosyltransferase [Nitrospirota bacterium]
MKGYDVALVVWSPPAHEINVVPYDLVLSKRYPFLFRSKYTRFLLQIFLFLWSTWYFDLFIMCFKDRLLDRSILLRWVELQLIQLAGKKIILNTYGDDIMTPHMTLGTKYKYSVLEGFLKDRDYANRDECLVLKNRNYCQKWADYIVSAIDHVQYLERIDDCLHMRCVDLAEFTPACETSNSIPVIAHAPNHRLFKGTAYLIKAVDELNEEGVHCTLNIIEQRPHNEVLEGISCADIAADQFLVGAYARFAIESMALCKPVVCYLRDDLFELNPVWEESPIVNANPDNLKEKLKELILMSPTERSYIGKNGRAYVEKYHSIEYIGNRMHEIIARVWFADKVKIL